MLNALHETGIGVAAAATVLRLAVVVFGTLRSVRRRDRFRTFRVGLAEVPTPLEPFVAGIAVYLLLRQEEGHPSALEAGASVAGALLALCGLGLVAWALRSWPGWFVGHGVMNDQALVTTGAYALVRHPFYLAVLLLWAALALAFLSWPAALVTACYVVPAYLLYARSEERMLVETLGARYHSYQRRVPMMVPRLGR
jgi:protein-S-isoprenylcysteine O-methyltransferase Ste14